MQILVLGMHRSGTSLTTRIINMMGAYFGPDSISLGSSPDNPKGFWERRDVLHINQALLHHAHCTWFNLANWDDQKLHMPPPITHGLRSIIQHMDAYQPWVIKDPRLCITLPCWKPYLTSPIAIIAWRDPLEIARSLQLRNDMPIDYALALWEYHAVHLIRHAGNLPKIFTRHDAMMANPLNATKQLYQALTKAGVQNLKLPANQDILSFVEPTLHRARKQDVNHSLTAHQQTLSSMLRGEKPFDPNIQISPEAKTLMQKIPPLRHGPLQEAGLHSSQ